MDSSVIGCVGVSNTDNLRDHAAHLGRSIKLALAFAALGGEMPHQVLVRVAKKIIAFSAILREIECRVLKNGDEISQAFHHLLATPSFPASLKSGMSDKLLAWASGPRIFLFIWSPMSGLPFSATMSSKLAPWGIVIVA